jgi:[ribosomal protein S18]-alanine N-acetyltransferase
LDTSDPIAIRNATAGDITEMLRLERSSNGAAHWSESQYQSLIGAKDASISTLALVAACEANPVVVGFLVARHLAPEWELENIVVTPEARGKGIGTRLMQELLARVQQANSHTVFLEVRESNAAAICLYEKLGFQQTGRRKSYYSNPVEDALLYCKNLGQAAISS